MTTSPVGPARLPAAQRKDTLQKATPVVIRGPRSLSAKWTALEAL